MARVRLVDLLDRAGARPDATATVVSLEQGPVRPIRRQRHAGHHPDTLLALKADGQVLSHDRGYPIRLIGPNRPGVMQTKWLTTIEVH